MRDYIERNRLKTVIEKNFGHGTIEPILQLIDESPTADVQPVVRGEWTREYTLFGVLKDTFWHCSVCGYKNSDSFANFDHKFCPNCGADMRPRTEKIYVPKEDFEVRE